VCELCKKVAETTLNGAVCRTFSVVSAGSARDQWMRVLVVEDEKRLAAGLRNGLEAEGFAVDVVNHGTDGLWMAREQSPTTSTTLSSAHPRLRPTRYSRVPGVNARLASRPTRGDRAVVGDTPFRHQGRLGVGPWTE
jgi:PleD family two-component response regulator